MAYPVTKENWWEAGELAAKPNTPVAIPIYGSYDYWVTVSGCVTSENPAPTPHTDPWNTPDFTVYGLWMKSPVYRPGQEGIGRHSYKTAAECQATYFRPVTTGDAYDGLYVRVGEYPPVMSNAYVEIPQPVPDLASLEFIGVDAGTSPRLRGKPLKAKRGTSTLLKASYRTPTPPERQSWRELIDPHILIDAQAVACFSGTEMGEPVLVKRIDAEDLDYYLVPFGKEVKAEFLASAVIILDANQGYFKEANWTEEPKSLLNLSQESAIVLIREHLLKKRSDELSNLPGTRGWEFINQWLEIWRKYAQLIDSLKYAGAELIWKPASLSASPYEPYWKIEGNGDIWYVTQEGEVVQD